MTEIQTFTLFLIHSTQFISKNQELVSSQMSSRYFPRRTYVNVWEKNAVNFKCTYFKIAQVKSHWILHALSVVGENWPIFGHVSRCDTCLHFLIIITEPQASKSEWSRLCFDWKISLEISIDEELPIHFKQSSGRSKLLKLDNDRNLIKEKKEIGHSNFGSSHQWCSAGCCLWICGFYVGSSLPNLKLVVVKTIS